MRRASLTDLPVAPTGKAGWPWTEESPQLPTTMPDGRHWPRISIVTPSYNQAQFVEETIRSILLQGYPNLEYIVMDGGSTDGSVEIIRKYAGWLSHWTSEEDQGQADAINKGFARCTGDLLNWINSDDLLLPGTLVRLARSHVEHPDAILAGDVVEFQEGKSETELFEQRNISFRNMLVARHTVRWHQPGVFVPRRLADQAGTLDKSLRYYFDQDWLCRLLLVTSVYYLQVPVARFRLHSRSKTVYESGSWSAERAVIRRRYIERLGKRDQCVAISRLEMRDALWNLALDQWDRRTGLQHLWKAFCSAPWILCSVRFVRLLARGLLPLRIVRIWMGIRTGGHLPRQSAKDRKESRGFPGCRETEPKRDGRTSATTKGRGRRQ